MILLFVVACTAEDSGVDLGDPAVVLPMPDVSGVDFAGAAQAAIQEAKAVSTVAPWDAHAALLGRRDTACPDLWAGVPDDESVTVDGEGGTSWLDHCTAGATDFDGWSWFLTSLVADGDAETAEGRTLDGTRDLEADATIADASGIQLEASGSFSDAISRTDAPDYTHWTWSSTVSGTVTGATAMDGAAMPGGWRSDLALYASGGDVNELQLDGNVYAFDDRIQDRFDSFEMDLDFLGEGAAGPDDCTAEPAGWIGLRDTDAYWYDLTFQPRYDDTGAPAAECDGCGELYVRGVADGDLGPVCLDFSFVWSDAPVTPPDAEGYTLSLHSLEGP